MKKFMYWVSLCYCMCTSNAYGANNNDDLIAFNFDTTYFVNEFINPFTNRPEKFVNQISRVLLLSTYDSLVLEAEYKVVCSVGRLSVFFLDSKLFEFKVQEGQFNGEGYAFYLNKDPQKNRVAIQATFKEGKMHGEVNVYDKYGSCIEQLMYDQGRFKKMIYSNNYTTKKSLRKRTQYLKQQAIDPMKNDEVVVVY